MSETESSSNAVPEATVNFYDILGILKTASEKEITEAFNAFSDNYDPSNEESANRFKEVTLAYETLCDPTKREQYDTELTMNAANAGAGAGVGGGLFGKAFGAVGALASRVRSFSAVAAVPPSSVLNPAVMDAAAAIIGGGSFEGGGAPSDGRLSDLVWGSMTEGKTERHNAAFYRLSVDNSHAENGFVVLCRSAKRDRFKLAMFDSTGTVVRYHEDSSRVKDKSYTQSALYFTSFDTYQLKDPPLEVATASKDLPPVFIKLANFTSNKSTLTPGQYLLCVYGDNMIGFGRSVFSIVALPAKNDAPAVTEIEETDESLMECKDALRSLKGKYVEAKAAFDAVQAEVKECQEKMDVLLLAREKSYQSFLDSSAEVFLPPDVAATTSQSSSNPPAAAAVDSPSTETAESSTDDSPTTDSGAGGGAGAYISAAATAASTYTAAGTAAASNAAKTASVATGWVARRLSALVVKKGDDGEGTSDDAAGTSTATEEGASTVPAADPAVAAAAASTTDFFEEPAGDASPPPKATPAAAAVPAADTGAAAADDEAGDENDDEEETETGNAPSVTAGAAAGGGAGGGKKSKKKAKKAAAAAKAATTAAGADAAATDAS